MGSKGVGLETESALGAGPEGLGLRSQCLWAGSQPPGLTCTLLPLRCILRIMLP